jgi:surfeit locus 1 family protein
MSDAVRSRSLLAPTFAMLVAVAILMTLGTWQVQRLTWKQALIETATTRSAAPAGPLPVPETWERTDFDTLDYTPVSLTGRFLHDQELYVYAPLSDPNGRFGGSGVWVMTPLELTDGHFVLVNRGFVPDARRNPATRAEGQIAGTVTIEGLLRRREPRDWLSPADDVARNLWFIRDARVMARAIGLNPARVAPFTVDARASATPPGGLPQAGETRLSFTNNHLNYAVTWYGLAVCAIAVYFAFVRSVLRRRAAP